MKQASFLALFASSATTIAAPIMILLTVSSTITRSRYVAAFKPSTVNHISSFSSTKIDDVSSKFLGRTSFILKKNYKNDITATSSSKLQMTSSESRVGEEEVGNNNSFEKYQNKKNLRDQVLSVISANGEIKVTAATTRNLVNDVMLAHTLAAVPADALARAMTCSLLLSNGMQAEQTFQLTLNCDGPIRGVVAVSNGKGEIRGYVGTPGIGEMPIQEAIGKGTVQVVKNHPDWPNPYNGITAIEHGDVDRDVGIYLAESEQRSCALAAATTINGILCTSAGGYVVEQLPGCTPETIAQVEKNLANLVKNDGTDQLPTGILLAGGSPLDICGQVLQGLDMQPLQEMEPKFTCGCSEERLFRAVRLLPKEDIEDIMKKEEQLEARCQFCGKVYRMSPDEVAQRYATAKGDPSLDEDFEE